MVRVTGLLLFLGLLSGTFAVSCPDMVEYAQSGLLGYLGIFRFTIPVSATQDSGWVLAFQFDQEFIGIGAYGGVQIESNGLEKWANISNSSAMVEGDTFSQSFRIRYNRNITAPPELSEARFQNIVLCP